MADIINVLNIDTPLTWISEVATSANFAVAKPDREPASRDVRVTLRVLTAKRVATVSGRLTACSGSPQRPHTRSVP